MTPTPIAADLPEPAYQYRLKGEEAWHDEGSGPTPDAWHHDCVQPDHEWRALYTADQVREAIEANHVGLRAAVRMLLDSAPKNMCPRNAKEREAYKVLRTLMKDTNECAS